MKYTLVLETKNAIAKFPYTDKELATKRFKENKKNTKFVKVELIVEENDSFNKEPGLLF